MKVNWDFICGALSAEKNSKATCLDDRQTTVSPKINCTNISRYLKKLNTQENRKIKKMRSIGAFFLYFSQDPNFQLHEVTFNNFPSPLHNLILKLGNCVFSRGLVIRLTLFAYREPEVELIQMVFLSIWGCFGGETFYPSRSWVVTVWTSRIVCVRRS